MLTQPEPIYDPDLSELTELCSEYISQDLSGAEDLENLKNSIFEETLIALYGKGIFDILHVLKQSPYEDN